MLGQLQAAAAKQARAKEVAAWQRLGKAVQVGPGLACKGLRSSCGRETSAVAL